MEKEFAGTLHVIFKGYTMDRIKYNQTSFSATTLLQPGSHLEISDRQD